MLTSKRPAPLAAATHALHDWGIGWKHRVAPRPAYVDGQPLRRPGAAPVYVLPGVWETWPSLLTWGEALWDSGFDVRLLPQFDGQFGPLSQLASKLRATIAADAEAAEAGPPLVVAHSKGGLVAKQALAQEPGCFQGVVTVGTPFAGAPLAGLAPSGLNLRDLRPSSPQILRLQRQVEPNRRIIAISAKWDQNVPDQGRLPGAIRWQIPVIGHNELLKHPAATAAVVKSAQHIRANW